MGRELTANAGVLTPMWRRARNGELIHVEPDTSEYQTPPDGLRARFRLSGISDTFELPDRFSDDPTAMKTSLRVEFEIAKAAGNIGANLNGKRFTGLYTASVHPRSNLGRLLGRLRGRAIEPGETVDIDGYIGTTFVAMTALSGDGNYASIAPEAIERASVELPAWLNGTDDDTAGLVDADDDPFEGSEDDPL